MMDGASTLKGRRLWLLWTLASILGSVAGIAGGLAVHKVSSETPASLIIGLAVGLAQWLVLRRLFRPAAWWIAASALGIALAFAIIGIAQHLVLWGDGDAWIYPLGFLLAGALTGLGQWLLLRLHVCRAGWWLLPSALCWVAGGLLFRVNTGLSGWLLFLTWFAALGLILGAGTGAVLAWLARNPASATVRRGPGGRIAFASLSLTLTLVLVVVVRPVFRVVYDPDLSVEPACSDLPPLRCTGDEAYCSQIVFFEPVEGPGYINYPHGDETADNQYRSYLRRDVMMAIQYATASVACETRGWKYLAPPVVLGLGDMSESDGSRPGTSIGYPTHPMGSHEGGLDIDVAYYQAGFSPPWFRVQPQDYAGNLLRPVCKHTLLGINVYHCVEPPVILDRWRTALFIARIAEHPRLRVIGVDGKIGPPVEAALDALTAAGWIDPALRAGIPLTYEPTDQDGGFYLFHHQNMHISFRSR